MAGNTLPLAKILNPRIRETSDVVVHLPLVSALRMIDTCDHRSLAKEIHLDVLDVQGSGLETRVFDIGKKFLFVGKLAIPFGIHKPDGNQPLKRSRIAIDLRLIPQMLQNQQIALAWIGLLGGPSDRAQR